MAIERTFKMDFWGVTLLDEGISLDGLLERLSQNPRDESSNVRIGDGHLIRLQHLVRNGDAWEGCFRRIDMADLPLRTKIDGTDIPLEWEDDEGQGRDVAFLFVPNTGVLVTQRNRLAVSHAVMGRYFKEKGGLLKDPEIKPHLRFDALQKLSRMNSVRRIEVAFAELNETDLLSDQSQTLEQILNTYSVFRAPYVTITMSVGRRVGFLDKAKELVNELMDIRNIHGTKIRRVLVTGVEEEVPEILDMIDEKIIAEGSVTTNDMRQIPYDAVIVQLRQAYRENLTQISSSQARI